MSSCITWPREPVGACSLFRGNWHQWVTEAIFEDNPLKRLKIEHFLSLSCRRTTLQREKCKCIHFVKANLKQEYTMGNHRLETVKKILALFYKRTAASIKKANNILGVMKRTFMELDFRTLPLLYKSMVRPHLE